MQEGFCVRRNATHTLRALGSPVASVQRGRGGVHGEARAVPARGIGHRGQHWAGGEVTVQGWSVALCPRSGILGGHGDVLGGVGWLGRVSARCGRARGPAGRRPSIRGRRRRWWSKQKGEGKGFWQGLASGSPPSLRSNQIRQGRSLARFPCWALQRFASETPLVGLKRNKKRERRMAKLGHALTEFKFELEFSHTRFESLSK
jgi:hypothetical protein